jgi:hypothetical protein
MHLPPGERHWDQTNDLHPVWAGAGVSADTSFEVAAAKSYPGTQDLVAFFDCLHDWARHQGPRLSEIDVRSTTCSTIRWMTALALCTLPRHPSMLAMRIARRFCSNTDGHNEVGICPFVLRRDEHDAFG